MSVDEIDKKAKELMQKAASWDAISSPQTIDDFPLMPENFSDIYKDVSHLDNSLTISSKTECTWKTGLKDLFESIGLKKPWIHCRCSQTGGGAAIPSSYVSVNNDSYVIYISDLLEGSSPEDLDLMMLHDNWQGSTSFQEGLMIGYRVEHGKFTGEAKVCIFIENTDYWIEWVRGFDEDYDGEDEDILCIRMLDYESNHIYDAVYNPGTGQQIRFRSY